MDKHRKLGKTLGKLARAVFIIAVIGCIACAVGAVLSAFTDIFTAPDANVTESLTLGSLKLELSPDYEIPTDLLRTNVVFIMCLGVVQYALIAVFAELSRRILMKVHDAGPFAAGISSGIKKLAFAALIGGAVISITNAASELILINMFDPTALFNSESVLRITFSGQIDATFVVVFAVLYMLSYVFRCGEELQRESDETL